ncbi:hypothetical protein KIW84_010881 [Lathyrus oleraceus]|uniref:Uncharacterized protein n=1 Tax=Pisum sativum TaxID=3888 RepID=A0A9D5BE29_PEA|nr:hypothetical protein KIW84_010881 [Pisum sativum]
MQQTPLKLHSFSILINVNSKKRKGKGKTSSSRPPTMNFPRLLTTYHQREIFMAYFHEEKIIPPRSGGLLYARLLIEVFKYYNVKLANEIRIKVTETNSLTTKDIINNKMGFLFNNATYTIKYLDEATTKPSIPPFPHPQEDVGPTNKMIMDYMVQRFDNMDHHFSGIHQKLAGLLNRVGHLEASQRGLENNENEDMKQGKSLTIFFLLFNLFQL